MGEQVFLSFASLTAAVAIFASASYEQNEEGRSFENVKSVNQRLELTTPLKEIPLTYEAVIKIEGTTDALCKGTLFGNYGNGIVGVAQQPTCMVYACLNYIGLRS